MTDHVYLSTACLHGEHSYCQARERVDGGTKTPAQCKFCGAPCVCPCHAARAVDPLGVDEASAA